VKSVRRPFTSLVDGATPVGKESEQFMLWPAVTVIGFLVLTAFVIALGIVSTGRYEREQRARANSARPTAQSIGVARTT
jgi:hypothetical protein